MAMPPELAAATAGPVHRTGKASAKVQERFVWPSWVAQLDRDLLELRLLARLLEPLLERGFSVRPAEACRYG